MKQLIDRIHKQAIEKGFYEDVNQKYFISHQLLEITKEVAEASEAHKNGKIGLDKIELTAENKDFLEFELADVVIRCMDLSAHLGFDLEAVINAKLDFNKTRPKLHGKEY